MKFILFVVVALCATVSVQAMRRTFATQGQVVSLGDSCGTKCCAAPDGSSRMCPHAGGVCCSNTGYCCPSGYTCSASGSAPSCTKSSACETTSLNCNSGDWVRPRIVRSENSAASLPSSESSGLALIKQSGSMSESSSEASARTLGSEASTSASDIYKTGANPYAQSGNIKFDSNPGAPIVQNEGSEGSAAGDDNTAAIASLARSLPLGVTVTTTRNVGGKVFTTTITRQNPGATIPSESSAKLPKGESSIAAPLISESSLAAPPAPKLESSAAAVPPPPAPAPAEASAPEVAPVRRGKIKLNSNVEISIGKPRSKTL